MLEIRPFRALRFTPKAGDIGSLCCPPYDVISDEQRAAYLSANPHNIIRLEAPRGQSPYLQAASDLQEWLRGGLLRADERPGIYLYEEEFLLRGEVKRVKGFIARVRLEEFSKGIVLPHEETLSKAKADRFSLMEATGCNFSQIYSLYFDEGGVVGRQIEQLSAGRPQQQFTDADGVTHRLWCVYDEDIIARLAQSMACKTLYIADGHHRYETALAYRDRQRELGRLAGGEDAANFVMMMLVRMEEPGLVVFPTHRLVRGLEHFSPGQVLEGCAPYFALEKHTGPVQPELDRCYSRGERAFAFYTGAPEWHLLLYKGGDALDRLLPGRSEAYKQLEVSILHALVLERVFGIGKENMANQENLLYTRSAGEAMAAVDSGQANCAFLINPTRVQEIAAVAAAREKMPQKSTYFYPKLITGLVMNQFAE